MDNIVDLSVIVPCHNLEYYIAPLLGSFIRQNYYNINVEFIFVLDACQDNTEQIIAEHMSKFDCTILTVNNYSSGISRNDGLAISRGRYIWFVDGDDEILGENTFIQLINAMDQHNLDILKIKFKSNFFNIECPFMMWQYILRRDFIKDMKFLNIQPHEDREFYYELIRKKDLNQILLYDAYLYYYNYNRPNSNTTIARTFQTENVAEKLKELNI